MMRMNKLVIKVGVVLLIGAAPIFSVAHAQQNSQARMLLEFQEMRQEIAELRDMIERQQYQIRKMQRAQSGSQSTDSYRNQPRQTESLQTESYQTGPGQTGSYSDQNTQTQSYPDQVYSGEQTPAGPQSADTRAQYQDRPQSTGSSLPTTAEGSSFPTAEGSSLPNYSDSQRPADPPVYRPNPDGVEERVITAPPVSNDPTNGYPPVEDRSIGSTQVLTENPAEQPDFSQAETPQSSFPTGTYQAPRAGQVPSNPNLSTNPQINAPTSGGVGGVISVPPTLAGSSSGANDQRTRPNDNEFNRADTPASSQGISSKLSESDYYSQAFGLMKQSKFDEAVTVFEEQLKAYPQGDSADDAHYWIAEAMYVNRNLDVAKTHLKTLIQDHPQSQRVPDAMLKTAYIEQQQGNQIEARILFQEIVNYHPKSDAAIAAKNRLAENN